MNKIPIKELEELVVAGIIPEETAENISNYYQKKKQSAPNTFILILGVLGALLTGSGILLIIAHNWDELSILIKTILSFLPLLIAQVACGYTLLKRKSNKIWVECSSMFLFFAVGASISLIAQVYQVNGSLSGFLLTWALLAVPMIYILSTNTLALFCIAAITWYASEVGYSGRHSAVPYMYAIVLLSLIPYYYGLYKRNSTGNFYSLFNWFFTISLTVTLGCFINRRSNLDEWLFLLYCILFCIYYLVGRSSSFKSKRIDANPFLIVGTAGVLIVLLILSYTYVWNDLKLPNADQLFSNNLFYLIVAGLITVVTITWKNNLLQTDKLDDPLGYSYAILIILYFHPVARIDAFVVNAWIVFAGIAVIRKGSSRNHLGLVNFGLVIIAALAICRFFDDRIPFIWRGMFFLATGIAFFAANYLLIRRRRELLKSAENV